MAETVKRLDRISAEAERFQLSRVVLTVLLTPFYVLGWLAGKGWRVIAHGLAAIKVGWREGNGS